MSASAVLVALAVLAYAAGVAWLLFELRRAPREVELWSVAPAELRDSTAVAEMVALTCAPGLPQG